MLGSVSFADGGVGGTIVTPVLAVVGTENERSITLVTSAESGAVIPESIEGRGACSSGGIGIGSDFGGGVRARTSITSMSSDSETASRIAVPLNDLPIGCGWFGPIRIVEKLGRPKPRLSMLGRDSPAPERLDSGRIDSGRAERPARSNDLRFFEGPFVRFGCECMRGMVRGSCGRSEEGDGDAFAGFGTGARSVEGSRDCVNAEFCGRRRLRGGQTGTFVSPHCKTPVANRTHPIDQLFSRGPSNSVDFEDIVLASDDIDRIGN